MTKTVRLLAPVLIAVALGPLIAGLAVCLLAICTSIFGQAGSLPIADLIKLFGFYIVFAYIEGGVIALFSGILVSIWMIARPLNATVVIAATLIATAGYLTLGALGVLGIVELTNARSNYLMISVLAVIAATGCWLLTRRFTTTA